MSGTGNSSFWDDEFSGTARLFPLPSLVMFPHIVQPLHVYEPRYCEMLEDALAGDRVIATSLLEPGWEADYEGRPPIMPIACVGRIQSYVRDENNRWNILLAGHRRARVIQELPPSRPFREAEIGLLDDRYPPSGATERAALGRQLLDVFRDLVAGMSVVQEEIDRLLRDRVPLGTLTDTVGYTLNFPLSFKQKLLAELDVDRRAAMLLERLSDPASGMSLRGRKFPPEFSVN